MIEALLVAIGAAFGAPARYLISHTARTRLGATPVAGTLIANLIGSFVLGAAVGAGLPSHWLALIGVGFCGALTTFSTFALEVWSAVEEGDIRSAAANLVLSLALGLLAAYAGWLLTA